MSFIQSSLRISIEVLIVTVNEKFMLRDVAMLLQKHRSVFYLQYYLFVRGGRGLLNTRFILQEWRQLPPIISWSIGALSFSLCLVVLIPGMLLPADRVIISIFIVPIALMSRIAQINFPHLRTRGILLILFIAVAGTGDIIWPSSLLFSALFGSEILFLEAFAMSCMRDIVRATALAKQQSLLAEQQLQVALGSQQHLDELKDQFLLNVSHELRTPLTEIVGYIDLLREKHAQLDAETFTNFLDHAAHGCSELELFVNNVLEATHLDGVPCSSQLTTVYLATAFKEIFDRTNLQGHEIQLDIPEGLTALANPQKLDHVFHNLLSNAVKYSPSGTIITINATVISEQMSVCPYVCVRVRDAGPGICASDMAQLFQKAVRLKQDLTGSVRGTGLGLYISKQLVESMGGRIWVESLGIVGQGSSFCFVLPGVPASAQEFL